MSDVRLDSCCPEFGCALLVCCLWQPPDMAKPLAITRPFKDDGAARSEVHERRFVEQTDCASMNQGAVIEGTNIFQTDCRKN